jgi:DNA-directed RNA polymerase subunit M/transcription elongation factor TFIIS
MESVSFFDKVEFLRCKDKADKVLDYTNLVKRNDALKRLDKILVNIKAAINIEAGVFEFAMVYVQEKKLDQSFFPLIYDDKLNEMVRHLETLNPDLAKIAETNGQTIPFMSPEQLFPSNWIDYNKKKEWKEYKKKNFAATDLYTCYKCGEKKCQVRMLQTRSADEPMTNFITCLVCGNTFKK